MLNNQKAYILIYMYLYIQYTKHKSICPTSQRLQVLFIDPFRPFLGQENENLRSQVEALKTRDPRDAGEIFKTFLGYT